MTAQLSPGEGDVMFVLFLSRLARTRARDVGFGLAYLAH